MRYFKDDNGEIFSISDQSCDDCLICADWVKITIDEIEEIKKSSLTFEVWLETVVKPKRNMILKQWDEYEFRCNRELFLGITPTYTMQQIMDYKHAVHMFPDGLMEIVDNLVWPTPPEE